MIERYRIDEERREVSVSHDGEFLPGCCLPFHLLRRPFDVGPNTDRRTLAYAIARDELIERGLIREDAT